MLNKIIIKKLTTYRLSRVLFANILYSYYLLYNINITFSTPMESSSVL